MDVSFYVSLISTAAEAGSRILVEVGRSWELNGELSESNENMSCCSGRIGLGVEY
jgi:hypothetical protein